jgi:hypothetical protein
MWAMWIFAFRYWEVAGKLHKFTYPGTPDTEKCNKVFNGIVTFFIFAVYLSNTLIECLWALDIETKARWDSF